MFGRKKYIKMRFEVPSNYSKDQYRDKIQSMVFADITNKLERDEQYRANRILSQFKKIDGNKIKYSDVVKEYNMIGGIDGFNSFGEFINACIEDGLIESKNNAPDKLSRETIKEEIKQSLADEIQEGFSFFGFDEGCPKGDVSGIHVSRFDTNGCGGGGGSVTHGVSENTLEEATEMPLKNMQDGLLNSLVNEKLGPDIIYTIEDQKRISDEEKKQAKIGLLIASMIDGIEITLDPENK